MKWAMTVTLGLTSWFTAIASASEIDFEIGVDDANQLVLAMPELVDEPYELFRVVGGDLTGSYVSIEPGWDGLAQATSDLAPLGDAARVALERVRFEDGFAVLDLMGQALLPADGELHEFVGEPEDDEFRWHQHLLFIASEIGTGETISATFRIIDVSGEHMPSEEFTLAFVAVDTPGCGAGACGAGAMLSLSMATFLLPMMRWRRGGRENWSPA